MYYGGAERWNLRDRHMFETLRQVLVVAASDRGGPMEVTQARPPRAGRALGPRHPAAGPAQTWPPRL